MSPIEIDAFGEGVPSLIPQNWCNPPMEQSPDQWAPPELCPLVFAVGNYNLGKANSLGDPVHPLFDPTVALDLDAAIAIMNAQGIIPTISEGFRTLSDQVHVNSGRNPKAKPGQSWHEIGVAVDIGKSGLTSTQWQEVVADMQYEGFTWGGLFTGRGYDPIHFQMEPALVHSNGTVTSGAPSMSRVTACETEHATGFY
jgi:hypothetical protein